MKNIFPIIGYVLIVFAAADFLLGNFAGINLTPFLPPAISSFSPIIIGGIGIVLTRVSS
tara:strand:+ start:1861 stop:2037 length:177 start_codon:yes stop_codon:yes gene_type:complete